MDPMQKTALIALLAVAVLLSACSDRVKDTHPQQLVSKRQALFKQFTQALEPMGLVARDRQDYTKSDFMASAITRRPAPNPRSGARPGNSNRRRTAFSST